MAFVVACVFSTHAQAQDEKRIVISKKQLVLCVIANEGDTICKFPCAVGRAYGNNSMKGDCKTPEGTFSIESIIKFGVRGLMESVWL